MKKQTQHTKNKKPIHLHVEHFFQMKTSVIFIASIMTMAMLKTDSKLIGVFREAYAHFGHVGTYMREETVRTPITFTIIRADTISGK